MRHVYFLQGPGQLSRYSDSLRTGRSGNRIPVESSFSAPFQTDPGAYPAFYTTGTGSFPGVKRVGDGVDHPLQLVPRLRKEQSYTSTPPLGLRGLFQVGFYLYLYLYTYFNVLEASLMITLQDRNMYLQLYELFYKVVFGDYLLTVFFTARYVHQVSKYVTVTQKLLTLYVIQ